MLMRHWYTNTFTAATVAAAAAALITPHNSCVHMRNPEGAVGESSRVECQKSDNKCTNQIKSGKCRDKNDYRTLFD